MRTDCTRVMTAMSGVDDDTTDLQAERTDQRAIATGERLRFLHRRDRIGNGVGLFASLFAFLRGARRYDFDGGSARRLRGRADVGWLVLGKLTRDRGVRFGEFPGRIFFRRRRGRAAADISRL